MIARVNIKNVELNENHFTLFKITCRFAYQIPKEKENSTIFENNPKDKYARIFIRFRRINTFLH